MSSDLLNALIHLEEEKGIPREYVIESLETALITAYRRNYGGGEDVEVVFDRHEGTITVQAIKEVVEVVLDSTSEISLVEALDINKAYEIGDKIRFEVTPENFGRIAAQTAKQVIIQRIREAERQVVYDNYLQYEDDILVGEVERQDHRYIYVNLGKIEAVLAGNEQIPGEIYEPHERIKVYVTEVENSTKGPQVFVSRSHPNLLKRLFEEEVPEIYDGIVEIVSVAREAGDRSKIAVYSRDPNVDAVGTCVGTGGSRVQAVVDELRGENMDIIEWSENPKEFIASALNPAQVDDVYFIKNEKSVIVIVPDNQLSLAIGKRGQNARLAAKLTGYKIDIKSAVTFEEWRAENPDVTLTEEDTSGFREEAKAEERQAAVELEEETEAAIDEIEERQLVDEEAIAQSESSLEAPLVSEPVKAAQSVDELYEEAEAAKIEEDITEDNQEVAQSNDELVEESEEDL